MQRVEEILVEHGKLIKQLWEEFKRLRSELGALGRRFAKGFEALFREAYADLLENIGVKEYEIKGLEYVDVDGKFIAPGAIIEADIVLKDDKFWVVEVKSSADTHDVTSFYHRASIVEKIVGRKADRKVLLAVVIGRKALEVARKLGVEVVHVTLEEG